GHRPSTSNSFVISLTERGISLSITSLVTQGSDDPPLNPLSVFSQIIEEIPIRNNYRFIRSTFQSRKTKTLNIIYKEASKMTIRIMIAEDEYLAKEELIYMLEKEKDIELCPSAETGEELIDLYFEHKPDVLMLDIEMPGMTGIDAARQILKSTKAAPYIIFITAYDTYAVEAFDIEAVDYLLKPFDQARFQKMLERLR